MPKISEESKQRNKEQLLMLIRRHNGLREAEITDLLSIERRTVNNYLNELEREGKVYKDGLYWLVSEHASTWLRRFELAADEAFTLYLAARQFVKQTDKQNPMALSALSRLAEVLKSDLPVSSQIFTAAQELRKRKKETDYESIFANVVKAYLLRHPLHLTYRTAQDQKVETVFKTYLIEPSAIGFTLYLIGHSSHVNALRSYKIERIETAVPDYDQTYTIPDDFPGLDILQNAWSIMMGETTERVMLRFSRQVKKRVLETNWHPSQEHEEEADGRLRWWVDVADTTDMKPWIRSWGSDVEVLEPEHLRETLKNTTASLSKIYQTMHTSKLPYQLPYAKTNPDYPEQIHLLLYHLIDVGQVALIIWQDVLTDSIRQRLASILNLTVFQAGQFIAFLSSLHDIGKAGPAYQQKYAPDWLKKELTEAGLGLAGIGKAYESKTPHGTVSTWVLAQLLPELLGLNEHFARQIAVALGGHHGSWPPPGATEGLDDRTKYPLWDNVRRDLFWELQAVFQPPTAVTPPANHTDLNTFLTIFSGLVSVADWLGSRNKECFGFVEQPMSTRQYADRATQKAKESLADLGWIGWRPDGRLPSFGEAFAYLPDIQEPRGVQQEVIIAAADAPLPTLLILEAPTGIGKTETAVYLANHWLQAHKGRGLYVAMPTQATSNQMYGRIADFLNHHYADMPINYHLVHGQAAWLDTLRQKVELQSVGDDANNKAGVLAESWFTPRKRTLLAPFGVGTVDQTLMSILQTRHFFVRLFGLSHKVVIFDEVHAYDTFMSTLFHRLLAWLSAIGTSVIILSATLPAKTRRELVQAYSGYDLPTAPATYPMLTIAHSGTEPQIIGLSAPQDISLPLRWDVGREPEAIVAYLQERLVHGGCAAVICNTVQRTQDIYLALDDARKRGLLNIETDDLILFHARFPPVWRQKIEADVLQKFGKPDKDGHTPHRPRTAVVIATQVIEQSLDLDFDLMITDLAPIDLLIQRAGRLHRHQRANRHGHQRQLLITQPAQDDAGLPDFGNDGYVYEPYILLRTYLALHEQSAILLPGHTTELIEAVYGDSDSSVSRPPVWQKALQVAANTLAANQHKAETKATEQLVLAPANPRLLKQRNENLDEESPDVHETLRAQTRDIDPGITLVCLHQEKDNIFACNNDGKIAVKLEVQPTPDVIKLLLQNSITVQHRTVLRHFLAQPVPTSWQRQATLRHCRPVLFQSGVYELDNYILKLSQALGLEICKKEAV